jgi:hypothetical protein
MYTAHNECLVKLPSYYLSRLYTSLCYILTQYLSAFNFTVYSFFCHFLLPFVWNWWSLILKAMIHTHTLVLCTSRNALSMLSLILFLGMRRNKRTCLWLCIILLCSEALARMCFFSFYPRFNSIAIVLVFVPFSNYNMATARMCKTYNFMYRGIRIKD